MAESKKVPGTGAIGAIKDDAQSRYTWLIVVAAVVYLVVIGRVFNKS